MSSAKIPPRFVPTLTDVVPGHGEAVPQSEHESEPLLDSPLEPSASQHQPLAAGGPQDASPWAREGMLAPRRGMVSLPASLPPLPPGLAPQPSLLDELTQAHAAQVEPPELMLPPGAPDGIEDEPAAASAEPVAAPAQPVAQEVDADPAPAAAPAMADAMDGLWEVHAQKITEEYLVHRLMQRVDLVLDQRLREAIASVVQEQTRSIVVRLREEVESVVRQAVYESVADELAQQAKSARDKGPHSS